eukprot:3230865-Rhodomonas_salina.1
MSRTERGYAATKGQGPGDVLYSTRDILLPGAVRCLGLNWGMLVPGAVKCSSHLQDCNPTGAVSEVERGNGRAGTGRNPVQKPHFQYSLHQKSGFLYFVFGV